MLLSPINGYFFMKNPKNIVITGASSGLGAALARRYAGEGVTLHLSGRHMERLQAIAMECQSKGATVYIRAVDVTDAKTTRDWLAAADAIQPVDLIIANAGVSAGIGGGGETEEQTRTIFAVNVDGVINTIEPLLPLMVERRHGQIAIMSSLAGIRGLSSSPAYSASKAAVRTLGEGLRGWLKDYGVEVNVICPGFIKTPMTDINPYPMPCMMDGAKAAAIIAEGLARNKARIAFPKRLYWPLAIATCLPIAWTDPLFTRMPGKPSF
jgi:short-subunit dehydrogenase